jgi:hypothetical protein
MITTLEIFKSVGVFELNSLISNYEKKFPFIVENYKDYVAPSVNYSLVKPKITLYVINERIDSIACYEELYFNEKNLLNLTLKEFMDQMNQIKYDDVDELLFEDDNIPQFVYEFEKIGMQVWTKGINGKIVTIIVNNKEHYLDN